MKGRGTNEKMDRKMFSESAAKNKFLIIICVILILGTFFGLSMLKFLPDEFKKNLFIFLSSEPEKIYNVIINKFTFPFITLFCLYFSGTSLIGNIISLITIFIYGSVYGFRNGIIYMFNQNDYILKEIISYFSGTLFFGFLLILMAENSFNSALQIRFDIKKENKEKPHYNARKYTVKFFGFTVVFAII